MKGKRQGVVEKPRRCNRKLEAKVHGIALGKLRRKEVKTGGQGRQGRLTGASLNP